MDKAQIASDYSDACARLWNAAMYVATLYDGAGEIKFALKTPTAVLTEAVDELKPVRADVREPAG